MQVGMKISAADVSAGCLMAYIASSCISYLKKKPEAQRKLSDLSKISKH